MNKDCKNMEMLKANIISGKFAMTKNLQNTIYQNIISSCLRVNPKRRAKIEELLGAFK